MGVYAFAAFVAGLASSAIDLGYAETAAAQTSEAQPAQHDDHHGRSCGHTQCYGDDQCCFDAHTFQYYCAHSCGH